MYSSNLSAAAFSAPREAPSTFNNLDFKALERDLDLYQKSLQAEARSSIVEAHHSRSATAPGSSHRPSEPSKPSLIKVNAPAAAAAKARSTTATSTPTFLPSVKFAKESAIPLTEDADSPESLAANDPFATQLWKFYAKAKASLPHGQRMENLSWRLGGMKLGQVAATKAKSDGNSPNDLSAVAPAPAVDDSSEEQRGRKSRSVGASPAEVTAPEDDE